MKKSSLKNHILFLVKLIIVALILLFAYFKLKNSSDFPELLKLLFEFNSTQISYLILLIILMLANWLLESEKWRFIISKIEKLKPLTALSFVWTGVSIGTLTPNRIGEFVGRVMFLKPENRKRVLISNILSIISLGLFFGIIIGLKITGEI